MKDSEIHSLLRKKFPEKEYALLKEVSDASGFNRRASADFIFMNLWPSRGLTLNAIEVKAHRSDWLSELKKPDKAERIGKYCDLFWLLTTNSGVAKIEEIPATWGWMNIDKGKLKILKSPTKRDVEPQPISRDFLAALLKRAGDKTDWLLRSEIQEKIDAEVDRKMAIFTNEAHRSQLNLQKDYNKLYFAYSEYKEITGIDILPKPYFETPEDIGKAVNFVKNGGVNAIMNELFQLGKTAEAIHEKIKQHLLDLPQK